MNRYGHSYTTIKQKTSNLKFAVKSVSHQLIFLSRHNEINSMHLITTSTKVNALPYIPTNTWLFSWIHNRNSTKTATKTLLIQNTSTYNEKPLLLIRRLLFYDSRQYREHLQHCFMDVDLSYHLSTVYLHIHRMCEKQATQTVNVASQPQRKQNGYKELITTAKALIFLLKIIYCFACFCWWW